MIRRLAAVAVGAAFIALLATPAMAAPDSASCIGQISSSLAQDGREFGQLVSSEAQAPETEAEGVGAFVSSAAQYTGDCSELLE